MRIMVGNLRLQIFPSFGIVLDLRNKGVAGTENLTRRNWAKGLMIVRERDMVL